MEYKYKGLELMPKEFSELMVQFFDGKQFSRQDAIKRITEYHLDNGGLLNKTSYITTFKSATRLLDKCGIENVGYGIWRLSYKKKDIEIITSGVNHKESYSADKVLGEGENAIYVYYYDCYKDLAILKGRNAWECKIGRTDVDSISRVFSQAGTCYPEVPHLALIINCKDSLLLERAIHSILKLQGKWLPSSPGKEWFITSPEEIEKIYNSIKN